VAVRGTVVMAVVVSTMVVVVVEMDV